MTVSHLSDEQIQAYILALNSGGRKSRSVEAHLCRCPECAERLDGLLCEAAAIFAALSQRPLIQGRAERELASTLGRDEVPASGKTWTRRPHWVTAAKGKAATRRPCAVSASTAIAPEESSREHDGRHGFIKALCRRPAMPSIVLGLALMQALVWLREHRFGTADGPSSSASVRGSHGRPLAPISVWSESRDPVNRARVPSGEPRTSIASADSRTNGPTEQSEDIAGAQSSSKNCSELRVARLTSLPYAMIMARIANGSIQQGEVRLSASVFCEELFPRLDERDRVRVLQTILADQGEYPRTKIDGLAGALTKQAVLEFQREHNQNSESDEVREDGILGPETQRHLLESIQGRRILVSQREG